MQSLARIKTENCNQTLCQACLSFDRKLNVLGEFDELFRLICFPTTWDMSAEIFLCWECRSVLKKIKDFQERVAKAHSMLNGYVENINVIKSLSNLTVIKTVHLDFDGKKESIEDKDKDILFVKHERKRNEEKSLFDISMEVKKIEPPHEAKPKISEPKIKEEINIDYNEDYADFEYEPIDEVKDENLPDALKELSGITIKKVKPEKTEKPNNTMFKRTLRYKMIHRNIENGVQKVAIPEKDLDSWISKEKCSTYFKNLKNKCEKCVLTIGRESLRNHYRMNHVKSKNLTYECQICQQWLSSEAALTSHIEQHYFYYSCTICSYDCYTKTHMRSHMRQHTRIVKCLECDATFTNTRDFFPHYRAYHRIFICDHCNKQSKNKQAIIRHINKHHIIHKCVECDLTFANYRSHRDHKKLQHRIERSEASYCVQCNIQFDNRLKFKKHINSAVVHLRERNKMPKKTTVPCPECPNVYSRKNYMINHYRAVHSKNYRFYCNICQKALLNSTRFKEHMMYVHEGREKQRNKVCYVCGKGFFTNRILENHMRTHTGERPFECAHCDARFAQKVALDSHVKFIHLKNKRKGSTDEIKKMINSFGTDRMFIE